jgi:hypothetical protein
MSGGTVILEVRVNKGICSVGENGKLAASGPDIRECLKHAVRDKPADARYASILSAEAFSRICPRTRSVGTSGRCNPARIENGNQRPAINDLRQMGSGQ